MPVTVIDIIKARNAGTFPIVDDIDLLGGLRVVFDTAARDAIPSGKRKVGMWVYTYSTNRIYMLSGGISNTNWIEHTLGEVETTSENLTIQINPTTGSDADTAIYQTQAQFTARGAFASYKGAIAAIPPHIRHIVRLVHADGTFTVADDYMGDLTRLTFSATGCVWYDTSSQLVRASGTTTMAVQSSVGGYTITLAADPGLVTNAYRKYWLRIASGTGAGQYKAIRSHNGVTFEVAGRFSPIDGTSVVEIVEPSVTLNVPASSTLHVSGSGEYRGGAWAPDGTPPVKGSLYGSIIFGTFRIKNTGAYAQFRISNISGVFHGTVFEGAYIPCEMCRLELGNLIVEAPGALGCIGPYGGAWIRGGSSGSSWLLRGAPRGITTVGGGRPCTLYLFCGSIDDCTTEAIGLAGPAYLQLETHMRSSGNAGYGIALQSYNYQPANVRVNMAYQLTYGGIVGASGAINLDGYPISYADLNAEPSHTYLGEKGSTVRGS